MISELITLQEPWQEYMEQENVRQENMRQENVRQENIGLLNWRIFLLLRPYFPVLHFPVLHFPGGKTPKPLAQAIGLCFILMIVGLTPACKKETADPDWSSSFTGCDVKKWPQLLPAAKRPPKEQINVTFYETEKAPTADNNSSGRLRLNEEQKCLLNGIKR